MKNVAWFFCVSVMKNLNLIQQCKTGQNSYASLAGLLFLDLLKVIKTGEY